jgi:hypothetical protein
MPILMVIAPQGVPEILRAVSLLSELHPLGISWRGAYLQETPLEFFTDLCTSGQNKDGQYFEVYTLAHLPTKGWGGTPGIPREWEGRLTTVQELEDMVHPNGD